VHRSKIEWVLNPDNKTLGWVWNPLTGCLNHTPEGLCLGGMFPCYAYKLANGRLKSRYLANENVAGNELMTYPRHIECMADPFYPRYWPERLEQIRKIKKPTGIFPDDMSDWMADYWPKEWTEAELQMMRDCPQHRFYTLTKQPQNLPQWSPFPDNCWVGVTLTNYDMARQALPYLAQIEATIKFVSYEPLLKAIPCKHTLELIDWVIIGACTGTKPDLMELNKRYPGLTLMPWGKKWTLQPPISWIEEIVRAADQAGVKVFLKDNLRTPILDAVAQHQIPRIHFLPGRELRQEIPDG